MLTLRDNRSRRYPNKPHFSIYAITGTGASRWLGYLQQVVKTGKWFYTPASGYDKRRTGPYETRQDALDALVAAERSTLQSIVDRYTSYLRTIDVAVADGVIEEV